MDGVVKSSLLLETPRFGLNRGRATLVSCQRQLDVCHRYRHSAERHELLQSYESEGLVTPLGISTLGWQPSGNTIMENGTRSRSRPRPDIPNDLTSPNQRLDEGVSRPGHVVPDLLDFFLVSTDDVMAGPADHDPVALEFGHKADMLLGQRTMSVAERASTEGLARLRHRCPPVRCRWGLRNRMILAHRAFRVRRPRPRRDLQDLQPERPVGGDPNQRARGETPSSRASRQVICGTR